MLLSLSTQVVSLFLQNRNKARRKGEGAAVRWGQHRGLQRHHLSHLGSDRIVGFRQQVPISSSFSSIFINTKTPQSQPIFTRFQKEKFTRSLQSLILQRFQRIGAWCEEFSFVSGRRRKTVEHDRCKWKKKNGVSAAGWVKKQKSKLIFLLGPISLTWTAMAPILKMFECWAYNNIYQNPISNTHNFKITTNPFLLIWFGRWLNWSDRFNRELESSPVQVSVRFLKHWLKAYVIPINKAFYL